MKIVDLTHCITPEMQVYPGSVQPIIKNINTLRKNGYSEKMLSMSSHTGTHIDAPAHMSEGLTLDRMELDQFVGKGRVIDISGKSKKVIEPEDVSDGLMDIQGIEFILLYSGWSEFWGTEKYFNNYPVLSINLARYLSQLTIKGIGLDAISIDPVGSKEFPNHMAFFNKGILIIENLTGLEQIMNMDFTFICNPLKIKDSDGSPVRAFAIINS